MTSRHLILSVTLASLLPSSLSAETLAIDPARLQNRSDGVTAQGARADGLKNRGAAVTEGARALSRSGLKRAARAELRKIWPEIQKAWPYLGDRGILIQVQAGVNLSSANKPSAMYKLENVFVRGAGVSPAHVWAEAPSVEVTKRTEGFADAPDESWFIWIQPNRTAWPRAAPSFEDASKKGILDRRESYSNTITEGAAIRGRLIVDQALRQEADLKTIESVAKAAELVAKTEPSRQLASQLRQSAAAAREQLARINERLQNDLRAAARAAAALMILDGVIAIGSAATKIADALDRLGPDAPASYVANMSEPEARQYINKLSDKAKAGTIEKQQLETKIKRDMDGKVQEFKQNFSGSEVVLPKP